MYIYRAVKQDKRYAPTKEITKEFPTEKETIEYLQKNGGGIYKNILHNIEFPVKGIENEIKNSI